MGTVYAAYCGTSAIDTTNAICEFNGFINHMGHVTVIIFDDKIVYQDNSQTFTAMDGQCFSYTIYFNNISELQRIKRNQDPLALYPGGVKITHRFNHGTDETIIIQLVSTDNFLKMERLWKRSQNRSNYARRRFR